MHEQHYVFPTKFIYFNHVLAVVKNLYCSCIVLVRTVAMQQNFFCVIIVLL